MKVLVVTNMYPHDGAPFNGIFVYEQVKAMERLYPEVKMDVYFINGKKSKIEYLISLFKVDMKIRKGKYDLVHIHFGLSGMYTLFPWRKRVPTIVTFHGSDIQRASTHNYWMVKISKQVAKRVDVAITLNDNMDKLVRELGCKTYIIPCGVDSELFSPIKGLYKSEKEKKYCIIFPSDRKRQVKDFPLFEQTVRILESKYKLNIVTCELKNMTRQEIADLFARADVLLLTSKSEGSPQVVKEAMACNLPCVCTPVGDVSYLLDSVKDSFVSRKHDAEELADLTAKSLLHQGVGITGRDRIIEIGLDEKSVTKKLYQVYTDLCE